ncbi:hypothetical protein K443DRAFT_4812 [Laccaria amethystina LaAM-08-1]|uniref:phosphoribosylglycinamide formyltransferase 1 n=1 Tax=Laccaria amethystina LaAM-08-1 TaxID=1095629 RepID=A0A0C9XGS9_9AGAR|nr:hypothetical protein K443DRAFT_4812 [Laccaria amethystina LaAM-08-1]
MKRIVVLISSSGTNLQALINALNTPRLPSFQITLVLSNRKAAYGPTRATPIPLLQMHIHINNTQHSIRISVLLLLLLLHSPS